MADLQPLLIDASIDPSLCPARPGAKPHGAIKLSTKLHPDPTYWCPACGAQGLPAPKRKAWKNDDV
jgi:hypothetical protein